MNYQNKLHSYVKGGINFEFINPTESRHKKNFKYIGDNLFERNANSNSLFFAGDHGSFIGAFSYVGSGGYVKNTFLGRYCSIGHRVTIGASSHALDEFSTHPSLGRGRSKFVQLGNDVWVGDGAVIMPGVVVGTGAVIGANAVVTKNVESYSIVAGVPAKHIRYRFEKQTRDSLLDSKWWDYRHEYLLSIKSLDLENFLMTIIDNSSEYAEYPTFKYFHSNS